MTSVVGRVYVVAASLLLFFVLWATVTARPWAQPSPDPRLAALQQREARVTRQAAEAEELVAARWAAYRAALRKRRSLESLAAARPAPAPSVRVVTLPPVTTTRTS